MKYMLLIYADERAISTAEREDCYIKSAQYAQALDTRGHFLSASPLQPVAFASSVRVREGRHFVTEGPFAETREQLGGFYLIEAPDQQTAIEIAREIPAARFGTVEVRPLMEIAGVPPSRTLQHEPEHAGSKR